MILLLIILGTIIWVIVDAQAIRREQAIARVPSQNLINPTNWIIACIALWIVGFPMYLAKRGAYKRSITDKE